MQSFSIHRPLHDGHINPHHQQSLKLKDALKTLFCSHIWPHNHLHFPACQRWILIAWTLKTEDGWWMNPLGVHPAHLSSHTAATLIFIHIGRYFSESWPLRATDRGRNRGREGGMAGGVVCTVNSLVKITGFGFRCWALCGWELAENSCFYV